MRIWHVSGTDIQSGEMISLRIEAETSADATAQAQHAGVNVNSVIELHGQAAAPPQSTTQPGSSGPAPRYQPVSPMLTVPLVISGVYNLLYAAAVLVFGLAVCCIAPLAIPLIILGVFEIVTFSRAESTPREKLLNSATTIGICQIVTLALGNVVSPVCGILVLVAVNQERSKG